MRKQFIIPLIIILAGCVLVVWSFFGGGFGEGSPRLEYLLTSGWKFTRDTTIAPEDWQDVTVPHDWAIYGPFDRSNDLQSVQVMQNGETTVTDHTGRTGGLPYVGKGSYRFNFDVTGFDPDSKCVTLLFDGAMSEPEVYVNGRLAAEWKLGYNAFFCDVTSFLNIDGRGNLLEVCLNNRERSSRWYPGAGLFRNVHLICTGRTHIPVWGTVVTTPVVSSERASVKLAIDVENPVDGMTLITLIRDSRGNAVARAQNDGNSSDGRYFQEFTVEDPSLWSPDSPALYCAETRIYSGRKLLDKYETRFGIRSLEVRRGEGFFLNGEKIRFHGVCNHHDLGPLGAAVSEAALRHQLTLLKEMGCNAIRTSHNMPAPELVSLCDEMGLMMMVEAFDEWDIEKCENGYHLFFDEWAEKDMVNMVRHYRNNPSVVMWSIGNEVPTQCAEQGYKVASFLQSICHREDSTRPVTCGMDQVRCVMANGFAQLMDIVGLNYRTQLYGEAFETLPQKVVLGSETASTVSSRGVYKIPAQPVAFAKYDDHQSSSYDLEHCWWSNIPDIDFALEEDYDWTMGQFVWTGFDYLGEPTPYDVDSWPNHSSLFGIIDLASLPKDRYYLYRSVWNKREHTLHLLPHWNWEGHEGERVPVFCYTDSPAAELFVNGVSQGIRKKDTTLLGRHRLIWDDVSYRPGEIEVVAYDSTGVETGRKKVVTAGEPARVELSADRNVISADGKDLAYITVRIVDANGNLCPLADNKVRFTVSGSGSFRALANGDPTCTVLFQNPEMPAFSGMVTAIVQSDGSRGSIHLVAESQGLESGEIKIKTK